MKDNKKNKTKDEMDSGTDFIQDDEGMSKGGRSQSENRDGAMPTAEDDAMPTGKSEMDIGYTGDMTGTDTDEA